jgi:hypothetical protein
MDRKWMVSPNKKWQRDKDHAATFHRNHTSGCPLNVEAKAKPIFGVEGVPVENR